MTLWIDLDVALVEELDDVVVDGIEALAFVVGFVVDLEKLAEVDVELVDHVAELVLADLHVLVDLELAGEHVHGDEEHEHERVAVHELADLVGVLDHDERPADGLDDAERLARRRIELGHDVEAEVALERMLVHAEAAADVRERALQPVGLVFLVRFREQVNRANVSIDLEKNKVNIYKCL